MQYKLSKKIIKLSNSTCWDAAKLEWNFDYAYYSEKLQTCLCGHYPIKNICVLKNKINNNVTEVGNCCVNKFLGIENGNKIFISIKRIKKDLSKSMSAEVLDYLNEKKVINKFEYNFYLNILRKRNLSDKQLSIKKKINQRLISFTSYEAKSIFLKIKTVLDWTKGKPRFDKKFILSIERYYKTKGFLSEKQINVLNNIMKKNKIKS